MPRFLPAPQHVREHWHRGSAVGSAGWVERSETYRRPRGGMIRAPRDVHDGLRGAQPIPRMLRYRACRTRKLPHAPALKALPAEHFKRQTTPVDA